MKRFYASHYQRPFEQEDGQYVLYTDHEAEIARLRGALEDLLPALEVDLRYCVENDDLEALRSRVKTVRDALSAGTSR